MEYRIESRRLTHNHYLRTVANSCNSIRQLAEQAGTPWAEQKRAIESLIKCLMLPYHGKHLNQQEVDNMAVATRALKLARDMESTTASPNVTVAARVAILRFSSYIHKWWWFMVYNDEESQQVCVGRRAALEAALSRFEESWILQRMEASRSTHNEPVAAGDPMDM